MKKARSQQNIRIHILSVQPKRITMQQLYIDQLHVLYILYLRCMSNFIVRAARPYHVASLQDGDINNAFTGVLVCMTLTIRSHLHETYDQV